MGWFARGGEFLLDEGDHAFGFHDNFYENFIN